MPRKRFFVNNTSLKTKIQRKPTRSRTNNMLIALHPLFSFRFVSSLWNCFSLFSANEYTPRSAIKDHDFFYLQSLKKFLGWLNGAYFYYWPLNKLSKVTTFSVNHICIWLYNDKVKFWKKKKETNTNLFLELERTFSSMDIRRTKRKLYFKCRFDRR